MTGPSLQDTPCCRIRRGCSSSCPPEVCCRRNTPEVEIQLLTNDQKIRATHQAVLQAREEVSGLQAVLDAFLRAVVSPELDHVALEQPLVEAVLITSLILPELKQMCVNIIAARRYFFGTHPCLVHFALAVSGKGLRVHLAPLYGAHQVRYGLLALGAGRPVHGTERLLE